MIRKYTKTSALLLLKKEILAIVKDINTIFIRPLLSKRRRYRRKKPEMILINACALGLIVLVVLLIFGSKKKPEIPLNRISAFQIPFKTFIELNSLSEKYDISYPELISLYALENNFFPMKAVILEGIELEQKYIVKYDELKRKYSSKDLQTYRELFDGVLDDLKCFPVGSIKDSYDLVPYIYGDSWNDTKKEKQGVDIIDRENIRGRLPVVSMTDGTVKAMGWSDEGGYYVDIESKKGNVYSYEHLDRYYDNLGKGTNVKAGTIIGYMGDTQGKSSGTVGKTRVHLSVSILVKTSLHKNGIWLNPYPFLRQMEERQ